VKEILYEYFDVPTSHASQKYVTLNDISPPPLLILLLLVPLLLYWRYNPVWGSAFSMGYGGFVTLDFFRGGVVGPTYKSQPGRPGTTLLLSPIL
jgi:hypothetical protein